MSFKFQSAHPLERRACTGTIQTSRGIGGSDVPLTKRVTFTCWNSLDVTTVETYTNSLRIAQPLSLFATGLAGSGIATLAVDAAGNIYEAEEDSSCNVSVYRFDPQGVRSTFATITGNPDDCDGSAGFGSMAFDSQGNLFLSSGQYSVPPLAIAKIYKITPQGQASVFVDLRYGYTTIGLALDNSDNVFVLAVYSYSFPMQQRLFVYTSSGGGPSIFWGSA
jgi:hypothetical protein